MNQCAMAFSTNLKRLRKQAGLSQEQLALALGYAGQSTISNYEKGIRSPDVDEVPAIAKELGVDVAALFTESSPSKTSKSVLLDPELVHDVAQSVQEAYDDLGLGVYSITKQPEIFAGMYERAVAAGSAWTNGNLVWLGSRIKSAAHQGGEKDESSKNPHAKEHGKGLSGGGGSKS